MKVCVEDMKRVCQDVIDTRCRVGENIECKEEIKQECKTVYNDVCHNEKKKVCKGRVHFDNLDFLSNCVCVFFLSSSKRKDKSNPPSLDIL